MDEKRKKRLIEKYENSQASEGPKQMNLNMRGPGGGGAAAKGAMGKSGKPKNTMQTIKKLLRYLSDERKFLTIAIVLAIVHTISTLAASYMLRPIMNKFLYYEEGSDVEKRMLGLALGIGMMAVVYGISVFTQWAQQRIMLTVSQI